MTASDSQRGLIDCEKIDMIFLLIYASLNIFMTHPLCAIRAGTEITAKLAITVTAASVRLFGVRDRIVGVVKIGGRCPSGFMGPHAATIQAIPMIIIAGIIRRCAAGSDTGSYHKRYLVPASRADSRGRQWYKTIGNSGSIYAAAGDRH
jgi:hypothetical protein